MKQNVAFANSKNNFCEGFQHNMHGFRNSNSLQGPLDRPTIYTWYFDIFWLFLTYIQHIQYIYNIIYTYYIIRIMYLMNQSNICYMSICWLPPPLQLAAARAPRECPAAPAGSASSTWSCGSCCSSASFGGKKKWESNLAWNWSGIDIESTWSNR